jgi:hypothetical protein
MVFQFHSSIKYIKKNFDFFSENGFNQTFVHSLECDIIDLPRKSNFLFEFKALILLIIYPSNLNVLTTVILFALCFKSPKRISKIIKLNYIWFSSVSCFLRFFIILS